jgi:curli biogenesis system outer membrane secretion channel CsgG
MASTNVLSRRGFRTLFAGLAILAWASTAAAQDRVRVGLLPFDVASVEGGTPQAAESMAKLLRAQMISSRTLQPVLLQVPAGASLPLTEDQLAAIAAEQHVVLIVSGTILDASVTRGSNRIHTGSFGGAVGLGSVGGSMSKTRAEVQLHVELANTEGRVVHNFEVEGTNTDVGVGADLWTTLGGFDVGESSWDKSPMGKALREAAEKLASEVNKNRNRR